MPTVASLPGFRRIGLVLALAGALLFSGRVFALDEAVIGGYCCLVAGEACETSDSGACAAGGLYFDPESYTDCSAMCANMQLCGNGQEDPDECGPEGTCRKDCREEAKPCYEYDESECGDAAGCQWYEDDYGMGEDPYSGYPFPFCETELYYCGDDYCDDLYGEDIDNCAGDCQPGCGDETLDEDEECDDGNRVNGDGCNDQCLYEECGNGYVDEGEECDPDTGNSGDPSEAYYGSPDCTAFCTYSYCGNGEEDEWYDDDGNYGYEECDDGGNENGDGCAEDCTSEYCGNGFFDVVGVDADGEDVYEECDDGNTSDYDGCSAGCNEEWCGNGVPDAYYDSASDTFIMEECDDWDWENWIYETEYCDYDCTVAECGDGVVNEALEEECDLGEENFDGDGAICNTSCKYASCGDGVVDSLYADCDDGNDDDTDECTNDCRLLACGNGEVDVYEECDPYEGYDEDGTTEDPSVAYDNGVECTYECLWSFCGDGIVNEYADEQCDPDTGAEYSWVLADDDSADCNYDCTEVVCGDGYTNEAADEECDEGYICAQDSDDDGVYDEFQDDCTYSGECDSGYECVQNVYDGCNADCKVDEGEQDLCCFEYDYDSDYFIFSYGTDYTQDSCSSQGGYFVLTGDDDISQEEGDVDYYCEYVGACCDVDESGYDTAYASYWEECPSDDYIPAATADADGDGIVTEDEAFEACDITIEYICDYGGGTERRPGGYPEEDYLDLEEYVVGGELFVTKDPNSEMCELVYTIDGNCTPMVLADAYILGTDFTPNQEDCFFGLEEGGGFGGDNE